MVGAVGHFLALWASCRGHSAWPVAVIDIFRGKGLGGTRGGTYSGRSESPGSSASAEPSLCVSTPQTDPGARVTCAKCVSRSAIRSAPQPHRVAMSAIPSPVVRPPNDGHGLAASVATASNLKMAIRLATAANVKLAIRLAMTAATPAAMATDGHASGHRGHHRTAAIRCREGHRP